MALTKRTILEVIQDASREIGLPAPSAVVNSGDEQTLQLLQFAHRTGNQLQGRAQWPQLYKEQTITLVDGQASYALPSDMDRFEFRTFWDRSNEWELIGPLSPQEWQWFKSGVVTSFPRRRFRIKGYADKQFFVDPTPDSGDAGQVLVFEYLSQTWVRPQTYANNTTYAAGAYVFEDGSIYSTATGGTSNGATVATDAGITDWTLFTDEYRRFLADTDVSLLDEDVLILGIIWRFKQAKGLNFSVELAEYESSVASQVAAIKSAPTLDLNRSTNPRFISSANVPDTNFGN